MVIVISLIPQDIQDYWLEYCELESEFKNIIRYVSLIGSHDNVVSAKLADLMSITGNWVETAFNRMARIGDGFPNYPVNRARDYLNDPKIDNFRDTFEAYYHLSEQRIRVLPNNYGIIQPFMVFSNSQNPEWFRIYSRDKHNREELLNHANLRYVTQSLGALFLLNVMPMEMRRYLLKNKLVYSVQPFERFSDEGAAMSQTLLSHPHTLCGEYLSSVGNFIVETKIFKYEFARLIENGSSELYPSSL